jgi:uncharacterized membrane protein YbhN (UPF0104 family)
VTATILTRTRRMRSNRWLQFSLGAGIAVGLLALCFHSVDWRQTATVFESARLPWLVLAVVLNASVLIVWAAFLSAVAPEAEPVSFSRMFEIVAISWAIMNALPFFVGQISAVAMLVGRARITRHGALSMVALEQLGEGLSKVAVFLAVAVSAPIPAWMRAGIGAVVALVATFLGLLVVAAHSHRRLRGSGRADAGWRARARVFAADWALGLDALRSWRRSAIALAFPLATKAAEAFAIVAVQRAFGISLSLGATLLVLAAVMLATMVSVAPANLGAYEGGVVLAYRALGLPAEQALALAMVQHLCFLFPVMLTGAIVLSAPRRSRSGRGLGALAP